MIFIPIRKNYLFLPTAVAVMVPVHVWKKFLQKKLADDLGLTITVGHYPSGASKWNPIEHRMFSEISKNWRGKPLIDFDAVVNFAKDTTTKTGLHIDACRDKSEYEKGKKVSDKEMALLAITKNETLGKWNYTISPRQEHCDRNFSPDIFIPNIPKMYTHEKSNSKASVHTAKM